MGGELGLIRKSLRWFCIYLMLVILFLPGFLSGIGLFVGDYEVWLQWRDLYLIRCHDSHLIFGRQSYKEESPHPLSPILWGLERPTIHAFDFYLPDDLQLVKVDIEGPIKVGGKEPFTYHHRALMVSKFVSIGCSLIAICVVILRILNSRLKERARGFEVLSTPSQKDEVATAQ